MEQVRQFTPGQTLQPICSQRTKNSSVCKTSPSLHHPPLGLIDPSFGLSLVFDKSNHHHRLIFHSFFKNDIKINNMFFLGGLQTQHDP